MMLGVTVLQTTQNEHWYEVRRLNDTWKQGFRIRARSAAEARRRYCKLFGLRASDPWLCLEVRRVKVDG